jgi:hypothetical protein
MTDPGIKPMDCSGLGSETPRLSVRVLDRLGFVLSEAADIVWRCADHLDRGGSWREVLFGKPGGRSGGLFGFARALSLDCIFFVCGRIRACPLIAVAVFRLGVSFIRLVCVAVFVSFDFLGRAVHEALIAAGESIASLFRGADQGPPPGGPRRGL